MEIDLTFTPSELEKKNLRGKAVVVIDVLRATSTMIVAFESGCSAFIPVRTVEEARRTCAECGDPGVLMGGERGALRVKGFHLGNSPRDYRPEKVKGKIVVMTTTNGTQALAASEGASEVFIGSFLNLSALARRLRKSRRDVVIACSGEKGSFCLEDTVCGGALIDILEKTGKVGSLSEPAQAARLLYEHFEGSIFGMLSSCKWGQYLESIGLGRDVRICALVDSSTLVPVYRKGKIVLEL